MPTQYDDWIWVNDQHHGEWFLYGPGIDRFICTLAKLPHVNMGDPQKVWSVIPATSSRRWGPTVDEFTFEEAKTWAEDNYIPATEQLARMGRPVRHVLRVKG